MTFKTTIILVVNVTNVTVNTTVISVVNVIKVTFYGIFICVLILTNVTFNTTNIWAADIRFCALQLPLNFSAYQPDA